MIRARNAEKLISIINLFTALILQSVLCVCDSLAFGLRLARISQLKNDQRQVFDIFIQQVANVKEGILKSLYVLFIF